MSASPAPQSSSQASPGARRRRSAVSSEVVSIKETDIGKLELPPASELSNEDAAMLDIAMAENILFSGCDSSQLNSLRSAFTTKTFAKGDTIIKQGDDGDFFYVIRKGAVNVFVTADGSAPDESAKPVVSLKDGQAFGELALMYNQPRAASVKAIVDTETFVLARQHFRGLILLENHKRSTQHQERLKKIPLLVNLSDEERASLADAMTTVEYTKGTRIITQGDEGDYFYIIDQGSCTVHISTKGGGEGDIGEVVGRLDASDFFGELALLKNAPRAATVLVDSDRCRCARVDRDAFTRLLGPCEEILSRQVYKSIHTESAEVESEVNGAKELVGRVNRITNANDGCPWVRAKAVSSILEELEGELREVREALGPIVNEKKRPREEDVKRAVDDATEELGDMLFCSMLLTKVLYRDYHEGPGEGLAQALSSINKKLERRLPYIFGNERASNIEEASAIWQRVKAEEKEAGKKKAKI